MGISTAFDVQIIQRDNVKAKIEAGQFTCQLKSRSMSTATNMCEDLLSYKKLKGSTVKTSRSCDTFDLCTDFNIQTTETCYWILRLDYAYRYKMEFYEILSNDCRNDKIRENEELQDENSEATSRLICNQVNIGDSVVRDACERQTGLGVQVDGRMSGINGVQKRLRENQADATRKVVCNKKQS